MRNNKKRKSKLWRFFLWLLLFVVIVGGGAAVGGYYYLKSEYGSRAEAFDLEKVHEMESASIIFDCDGDVLGRFFVRNRDTIALKDLPRHLIMAVVAAEDNRFFQHHGIDQVGMIRAALINYRAKGITQGASTLTMQLARNSFDLREKSYERKLVEAFLAMRIEERYTKNEILEYYLNLVYYGAGLYGAEAASQGYFGKTAADLTLSESAMLAGMLKSPNNLSPWSSRRAAIRERDFVLGRMFELEMIDEATYQAALAEELAVKNRKNLLAQSYAIDQVRKEMAALGFENARSSGYRIHTTIDSDLQRSAERHLLRQLSKIEARDDYEHPLYESYQAKMRAHQKLLSESDSPDSVPALAPPDYLQGSLVILDNRSGGVLAMVGGRSFDHSEYNRVTSASRPAGTAFLPMVYAAGFEEGLFPGTPLDDSPMDNRKVMIGGTTGILGEWGPERDDNRYEGVITARQALVESKNAASVQMGNLIGLEDVTKFVLRAGITSQLRPFPATFLGSSEVTLLQLATAYTMFPGRGERPEQTYVIERIVDQAGKEVYRANATRIEVTRPTVAYEIHSCLSESLERGTADKARTRYGLKRGDMGGKTGTAYNFTDLWFLGYSSQITCGVWIGFDKPKTIYRGAFSSSNTLPVWVKVMNETLKKYPAAPITPPSGLKRVEICKMSGYLASDNCLETDDRAVSGSGGVKSTYLELVDSVQMPKDLCDYHNGGMRRSSSAIAEGQWPRAQSAVDLKEVRPVVIESLAVVGEDPYLAATVAQLNEPEIRKAQVEVRRAEPARPFDQKLEEPTLQIEAPAPLEF